MTGVVKVAAVWTPMSASGQGFLHLIPTIGAILAGVMRSTIPAQLPDKRKSSERLPPSQSDKQAGKDRYLN